MKNFFAWALLLMLVVPSNAFSQTPRDVTKAPFSRLLRVDSGGMGDYLTLSEALAYVASQPDRSAVNRWMVEIFPGVPAEGGVSQYEETSLICPAWTIIKGQAGGWTNGTVLGGVPTVRLMGSAGSLVTLEQGCSIADLDFFDNTATSGALKILSVTGPNVSLTNVSVRVSSSVTTADPVDILSIENNSSLSANSLQIQRNDPNAKTRAVVTYGNGSGTFYLGRFRSGLGSPALVENTGTGTISLYGTRLEGGAVYDVKRSGPGPITTQGVSYSQESGIIDNSNIRAKVLVVASKCGVLAGTGSPEGVTAANPCDLYMRSDGPPYLYSKVRGSDGNGWAAMGPVTVTNRPTSCRATETFAVTSTNEWCVCPQENTLRCMAFTFVP